MTPTFTSTGGYLVSRRNGVMLHFADRLAVTPLGADRTRCMFSSRESTIRFLITSGETSREPEAE